MTDTTDYVPTAEDSQADAGLFLIGNLIEAAKKRFVTLAVPWHKLSETEQERTLTHLADDVRAAVSKAITAIAAHQRVTFRAEVKGVNFKSATEVVATLSMVNSQESHALADVAGGFVTVVIEDKTDLLAIPDGATDGEPDTRPMFDAVGVDAMNG